MKKFIFSVVLCAGVGIMSANSVLKCDSKEAKIAYAAMAFGLKTKEINALKVGKCPESKDPHRLMPCLIDNELSSSNDYEGGATYNNFRLSKDDKANKRVICEVSILEGDMTEGEKQLFSLSKDSKGNLVAKDMID